MSDFTTNAKPPLAPCHHGNQPVCVECLKDDLVRARGEVVFFAERLEKQDHQYSATHPQAAIYRAKREALEQRVSELSDRAEQAERAYREAHDDAYRAGKRVAELETRVNKLDLALRTAARRVDDFIPMLEDRLQRIKLAALRDLIEKDTCVAPTHTDLMVSPESLEECMCSKNGCPIHDNGPCSICSKPFSECVCTAEQQTKAWRDWYKANVDDEDGSL